MEAGRLKAQPAESITPLYGHGALSARLNAACTAPGWGNWIKTITFAL
ncbi:MAG: hypothetical protein LBH04_00505 [Tannerellaceae bacterium]|nr:hypothetical protein [Tannerellaceae bacterium]